jgi:glucose uptake protein GlcU
MAYFLHISNVITTPPPTTTISHFHPLLIHIRMCTDSCGWIAALIGAISYGSYGVPIKATLDIDVHPFVLQSYKTVVLFAMSWFVLLVEPSEALAFTPYGIVSGFLWVSGGACGVYGIRYAGLTIAVGTWASIMVCVNFSFGILIFQEPMHSFGESCFAFCLLIAGLVGMSKYSANTTTTTTTSTKERQSSDIERTTTTSTTNTANSRFSRRENIEDAEENETIPILEVSPQNSLHSDDATTTNKDDDNKKKLNASVFVGSFKMTPRESGIAMSILNGILGGSALIPLHYAKEQGFQSWSYILSFGVGSLIANTVFWCLYFIGVYYQQSHSKGNAWQSTWDAMPSLHFKQLWRRGLLAGVLLSIGMFGSILATAALGQGVGNSLIQSKIIISGLWGIYYFKEISNRRAIRLWFLSAAVCVSGILLLSYERVAAMQVLVEEEETAVKVQEEGS